jgi:hypothetical protein
MYGTYDLIGHAKAGENYARYIPTDTLIVQNRDIKSPHYLPTINKYNNRATFCLKAKQAVFGSLLVPLRRTKNYLRIVKSNTFDLSRLRLVKSKMLNSIIYTLITKPLTNILPKHEKEI